MVTIDARRVLERLSDNGPFRPVEPQGISDLVAIHASKRFKQELDAAILGRADVVVADSIAQCLERGEIHKAIASGHVTASDLVELGDVIANKSPGRTSDDQVTVVDLTGVAVQDIQIATAVYEVAA